MIDPALAQALAAAIAVRPHFLLIAHIRPDGDAVGSLLGLGLALQEAGKQVTFVLSDGLPAIFRSLPGHQQVIKDGREALKSDPAPYIITLDTSDVLRIGEGLPEGTPIDACIDHHVTNPGFASLNLIDAEAVSTTAIITELLPQIGLPITPAVAHCLLYGLLTDSLGFRTSNVRPQDLRLAAILMECGAALSDVYFDALVRRSYESARLWGAGLSRLQREDGMIWTEIRWTDRSALGYNGRDDADLSNLLPTIDDTLISVLFQEQPNQRVKVSWRSRPPYDVASLAATFGGGGHRNAAGVELNGKMEEVQESVLKATRQVLQSESQSALANPSETNQQ